jgi:hypothetical protein
LVIIGVITASLAVVCCASVCCLYFTYTAQLARINRHSKE